MNIKVINVSNGTSEYPGNFTPQEIDIITRSIKGTCLHLFSGKSLIGDVRVDFSQKEATHNRDVFNYIQEFNGFVDTILLDPPYNERFAEKYNKLAGFETNQFIIFANASKTTELFNQIIRINPKRIIIKSWNYYVPKGYTDIGSYLCYAGGYRKPTILMICEKTKNLDSFL